MLLALVFGDITYQHGSAHQVQTPRVRLVVDLLWTCCSVRLFDKPVDQHFNNSDYA